MNCLYVFYNVNNVYDLFTNVAGHKNMKFLKEINLYTKIYLDNICSKYMV